MLRNLLTMAALFLLVALAVSAFQPGIESENDFYTAQNMNPFLTLEDMAE